MSEHPPYPIFALDADEVDERTPGVLLVEQAAEGDAKTTARDDGESWWIQDWDTMVLDDTTYWRATDGYRLDKVVVQRLYQVHRLAQEWKAKDTAAEKGQPKSAHNGHGR